MYIRKIIIFCIITNMIILVGCGNNAGESVDAEKVNITKEEPSSNVMSSLENDTKQTTDDMKRMIMLDGKLYVDTGEEVTIARCGVLDGHITSVVDKTEVPKKDGQANFGDKKIGYQTVGNGCIDVHIDEKWIRFELENKAKILESIDTDIVKEVTVTLMPPNTTVKLKKDEIKELIKILKEIVLNERDDSYTELTGQLVDIIVIRIDGTEINIKELTPFIIINDMGYKAEYDSCEELNVFVNSLKKGQ